MNTAARVRTLTALVVVLLPSAAWAGPRENYRQQFTTPVPGASTGTDTQILYKNPHDPKAKPIPVREERFTFPAGTRFDNSVLPYCTATPLELDIEGEAACPRSTWIGGGIGSTMTGLGPGESPMQVDGWNYASGSLLLGGSKEYHLRLATRAQRKGRVVTVAVPRTPGGPPDGESAIRRAHNVFAPRSLGSRAYIRTPAVCPVSGAWTFRGRFTFADGDVEHDVYRMPCRHQRARARWHRSATVDRGRSLRRSGG